MADVSDQGEWSPRQTKWIDEIGSGYTSFLEGDVLFAKITPCMENGKGMHAVDLTNGIGFGSTEFHVLRPKPSADGRFIFYWTISPRLRVKAESFMIGSAGQQRVQASFFDSFHVPELPSAEQRLIAQILDTVDEAIRKTEQLIAKLKLVKQGLLHDLLTRGIDDNGELRDPERHPEQFKDSPLGRIPREWTLVPLAEKCEHITKGSTPTTYGFGWVKTGGILFLRSECVREGSFSLGGAEQISTAAHRSMVRSVIRGGDVLMTITGYIGRSCRYPKDMPEANINQHIARIRPRLDSQLDPDFLMWALQDPRQRNLLERDLTGLAYPQISLAQVQSIQVPVPSQGEQRLIARSLNAVESRTIQETTGLEKLRLLKSGLMDDLLTGRVRVTPLLETCSE